MICATCGGQNDAGRKLCAECGAQLAVPCARTPRPEGRFAWTAATRSWSLPKYGHQRQRDRGSRNEKPPVSTTSGFFT